MGWSILRTMCVTAVFICVAVCPTTGEEPKHRVAVKTFENPANAERSTIGNALTEILITELSRAGSRYYELVDPGSVGEVLRQVDFNTQDWMNNPLATQQLAGANLILAGKVTNFSFAENKFQESVLVRGVVQLVDRYRQRVDVRVDFRLIDVKTGRVYISESGSGSQTRVSTTSGALVWSGILAGAVIRVSNEEGLDSLIGRSTVLAVQQVVRKLTELARTLPPPEVGPDPLKTELDYLSTLEGKILAQVGLEERIINLGKTNGLRQGDRLAVFSERVIRDRQGKEVYRELTQVGVLELVDVDSAPDRSKARLVEKTNNDATPGTIGREGDIVKVELARARELRADSVKGESPRTTDNNSTSDVEDHVKDLLRRGDRYLQDRYFPQAYEEYKRANELQPGQLEIEGRMGLALLYMGDIYEAETIAQRLLERGDPVELPTMHKHYFGFCTGAMKIQDGRLHFVPTSGDHGFSVSATEIISYTSTPSESAGPVFFTLKTRKDNKEKRFDFSFLMFPQTEEAGIENTRRLNNMVIRLIREYVKP